MLSQNTCEYVFLPILRVNKVLIIAIQLVIIYSISRVGCAQYLEPTDKDTIYLYAL